jgi:hypothetical protein
MLFDCPNLDAKIWSSTTFRVNIIREFLGSSKIDANRTSETNTFNRRHGTIILWCFHNLSLPKKVGRAAKQGFEKAQSNCRRIY